MASKKGSCRLRPPDGWITRDELVDATGVSDRNLLNWCAEGFVPRPGRGSPAFYRAESVAMIHRLYELQRQGRDADAWLWGLWLDPADYPVDMRPWILRRLEHAQEAIDTIDEEPDQIEQHVGAALKRGRLIRKLHRGGVNASHLRDLMLWAYRVAADIEQHGRLDNPDSSILATLRNVAGLPEKGFPAPDRKLGVELMAVRWLHETVEQTNPGALEQVRRDCRTIDRLAKAAASIDWRAAEPSIQSAVRSLNGDKLQVPPSVRARKEARKRAPVPSIVRILLLLWGDFDIRAILISGVIAIRQSSEHGKRLTEILALAAWALELAPRLPENAA
jgi:hypothetical protein